MSADELEAAGTGPLRFEALMRKYGDSPELHPSKSNAGNPNAHPDIPSRKRSFLVTPEQQDPLHQLPIAYSPQVFLLPGGRFMFLYTPYMLQLWDLGVPGGVTSRAAPHIVAEAISKSTWSSYTFHAALDGVRIRVLRFAIER